MVGARGGAAPLAPEAPEACVAFVRVVGGLAGHRQVYLAADVLRRAPHTRSLGSSPPEEGRQNAPAVTMVVGHAIRTSNNVTFKEGKEAICKTTCSSRITA
jgi:hypothetical protein